MKKIVLLLALCLFAAVAHADDDCMNGDCSEGIKFRHECRGVSTDYVLEKAENLEVYAENSGVAEKKAMEQIAETGREPLKVTCRNGWQGYDFD